MEHPAAREAARSPALSAAAVAARYATQGLNPGLEACYSHVRALPGTAAAATTADPNPNPNPWTVALYTDHIIKSMGKFAASKGMASGAYVALQLPHGEEWCVT